ncbi:MAG: serine/threonine protein phosphatase [Sphingomonadales bacterium]|nr:serine/threonine protein phosphatase [Sphingomonadales bacterium]MDE2568226.1 serine/threonine protein phosphatase [Sphingomonadales bacterium]
MIRRLRTMFAPEPAAPQRSAEVPAGQRVYAVGDIHGRLDLFEQLIAKIDADDAARDPADTTVVLLGDLVDRGPDSAGVIERARRWARKRKLRFIGGNHEEMFLSAFERDEALRHFLRYGGKETLLSYPIDPQTYERATLEELRTLMPLIVPAEHIRFMEDMESRVRIGDYLFVHAGIRPGVPVDEQQCADLRWIRGEFLDDQRDHGFVVVHGHTITDEVESRPNRIGIDTGAFASDRLTAIGLEAMERWFLDTL